jgi:hypothetical protein
MHTREAHKACGDKHKRLLLRGLMAMARRRRIRSQWRETDAYACSGGGRGGRIFSRSPASLVGCRRGCSRPQYGCARYTGAER